MRVNPEDLYAKLEPAAWWNILCSVIEVEEECCGDMTGEKNNHCIKVVNAYPWQTAYRGRKQVTYGNEAARTRLRNFTIGIPNAIETPFNFIGEFHSDPNSSELSEGDLDFFNEEIKAYGLEEWLEIVINRRKRRYKHLHDVGIVMYDYPRRMRFVVNIPSHFDDNEAYHGYDLTFGCYYFYWERGRVRHREVPLRASPELVKIFE
jgi:hypothetical protein